MTTTENGAVSLETTQDARLDLFFKTVRNIVTLSSGWHYDIRQDEVEHLFNLVDKSWKVDPLDTLKILFNWRDCRQGKGDHAGFLMAMTHIAHTYSPWFLANIEHVPEYGSYLDWVKLWQFVDDTQAKAELIKLIGSELERDLHKLQAEAGQNVTLVAKWIPTENGRWDRWRKEPKSERFIINLCRYVFSIADEHNVKSDVIKKLRTNFITPLRNHISLVETKLTQQKYADIEYEKVPSLAMNKYKKVFKKHDTERFENYLAAVKLGTKKINAQQMLPHDLVRQYLSNVYKNEDVVDDVIEEQWKAIKATVTASRAFEDSIVVCDVSSSMSGTPMEVAVALGLLSISDSNKHLITFSSHPTLHVVKGTTLFEQTRDVVSMEWGCNTNFSRLMELVLGLSVNKTYKRIYVFSDMQFDVAFPYTNITHFESVKTKFADCGIEMPTIVFWNLRGDTTDFPVKQDDRGVVMLSGYSPSLLKRFVSGNIKDITPLNVMLDIIRSERYDRIVKPLHCTEFQ